MCIEREKQKKEEPCEQKEQMWFSAAWELDRHGKGEYHVRTDFLVESTLLVGAVILMRGERRAMCTWHTTIFCCVPSPSWHMEDTPGQLLAGFSVAAVGHPAALEVPVRFFLCHGVIHVIELPPPGNLSDWAPHILVSA